MYKLNYFQKDLTDINCASFNMYKQLLSDNKISQPIIFCDRYRIDPFVNMPIFHSYFINQHFYKTSTLTDYDQILYIENFKNNNFIIVYNPDIHDISQYKNKYKFIDMNNDINLYMEQQHA
jgi:hypothetical protein